mgnify:CR=1 FL=1
MKKNNKRFSGISKLPNGNTSNKIVPGCIVLEGGAFRGLYTSGVLDALMQFEINMQCTVGTSAGALDRKSTRLNSSHITISYAFFC